jgi:hypothetical protein
MAPCVVTWTGHNMSTGQSITFTNSGGALNTGISANTQYFITKIDANTFKISSFQEGVRAGTFVGTSSAGTGTQTGHQPQARATALVKQNGAWYKTGALTRRYLGTFIPTATTATEDSVLNRFLFNASNRLERFMNVIDATANWAYATAAWRQARGVNPNQLQCCIGLSEDVAKASVIVGGTTSAGGYVGVGVGVNSTSVNSAQQGGDYCAGSTTNTFKAQYSGYPGVGYNALLWLEYAVATTTYYGGNTPMQSGMQAWMRG